MPFLKDSGRIPQRIYPVQGFKRKAVYTGLYEFIAVVFLTVLFSSVSDQGTPRAIICAIAMSTIAITWSLIFNTLFEAWESRQVTRGRGTARRIAHATGFQGGMLLMAVPFQAWWLDVSLPTAFVLNIGSITFFFIYSFVFTWAFDRIFGLPLSARSVPQGA